MKTRDTLIICTILFSVAAARAGVIFSEDFEAPDVTAADSSGYTSGAVPPGWVRATQGFGATRAGLIDKAAGAFIAADPNMQAYAFRYTNSGLTSGPTQMGLLKGNAVYKVTIEVQLDASNSASDYNVGLLIFESGASRNDCRGMATDAIAILANTSGADAPSGSFKTNTFTYTSSYGNAQNYVAKELAIRFGSVGSGACVDNLIVETLSEDTTPPTLAQADIVAGAASVLTWSNYTYTLTFDDWVPSYLIDSSTFTNVAASPAPFNLVSAANTDSNIIVVTLMSTNSGNLQLQVTTNLVDAGLNNLIAAVTDVETITVVGELIPPAVTSIVDNASGGDVLELSTLTYTVYFSEPVDSNQVTAAVFEDGGTSAASIDSVNALPGGVYENYAPSYEVVVTAGSAGTMILQIKAGTTIQDRAGNNLDTATAVADATVINVVAPATQDGAWVADQNGDWGDGVNWQGSNVAYGVGSLATFPNTLTANRTVTLDRDITIGSIDFQETGQDLSISGSSTLTLDAGGGSADLGITSRSLTIGCSVDVLADLYKTGNGTLVMSASNSITGDIILGGGTLAFSSLNSWGGTNKNITFAGTALISGVDGYSAGQVEVSNGATGTIDCTMTVETLLGSGGFGLQRSAKTLSILDGSGFTGDLFNLVTYSQPPTVRFKSLADSAGAGNIQFGGVTSDGGQDGIIRLYGDVGPLTLNNRQIEFLKRPGTSKHNFETIELENNNTNVVNTWVINTPFINNETYRACTLILGGSNTGNNQFAGVISDGGNKVLLYKQDAGRWILSGPNTYTGLTRVDAGTLVLQGAESIDDAGTINIAGGKVEIAVREKVDALQFNGVASVPATGTWGSTTSRAENKDDAYFTGDGVLYVGIDFPPSGTVLLVR